MHAREDSVNDNCQSAIPVCYQMSDRGVEVTECTSSVSATIVSLPLALGDAWSYASSFTDFAHLVPIPVICRIQFGVPVA